MVDELEEQARIARQGSEGLERHRQKWFQKGYNHGLSIKKKYGISGGDMRAVYEQCKALIKDEEERTRIPEIALEGDVLVLRSRAATYCLSLEAVRRKDRIACSEQEFSGTLPMLQEGMVPWCTSSGDHKETLS